MVAPTEGWHVEHIKAELRRRHGTLSALSADWGVNRNAISNVLSQPGYSRALERRIAEELGRPLHVIWPQRWRHDGSPISFRTDRTPTRRRAASRRQKAASA